MYVPFVWKLNGAASTSCHTTTAQVTTTGTASSAPSHARCLTLVVSNGIRHNREPGLHTSTIANTATITPIRNGFNANGTRTFARTASNGISEPFGSTIRTHTEPPAAAACTYSERGEDTDTELTVPACD